MKDFQCQIFYVWKKIFGQEKNYLTALCSICDDGTGGYATLGRRLHSVSALGQNKCNFFSYYRFYRKVHIAQCT